MKRLTPREAFYYCGSIDGTVFVSYDERTYSLNYVRLIKTIHATSFIQ